MGKEIVVVVRGTGKGVSAGDHRTRISLQTDPGCSPERACHWALALYSAPPPEASRFRALTELTHMSFWHMHIQSLVLQASLTSQATMPLYVVSLTISVFVPIIASAHGRRRSSATARTIV